MLFQLNIIIKSMKVLLKIIVKILFLIYPSLMFFVFCRWREGQISQGVSAIFIIFVLLWEISL